MNDIFEAAAINEELDAYNPLIPDGCNWKATFMVIEFPDADERRAMLTGNWSDIENNMYGLQVGDSEKIRPIALPMKTSSVPTGQERQLCTFCVSSWTQRTGSGTEKRGQTFGAGIDHENYQVEGLAGCRERTQFAGRRSRLIKIVLHAA